MSKEEMIVERNDKMIRNIKENYQQLEESIVRQLYMKHDLHGTTIGSAREEIWQQLFEMIIPKKFVIEQSVFIIDSHGQVSHEIDLAILDETYTPYIFRYGRLKFIPIEAVAAVVECKSQSHKEDAIEKWIQAIQNLKTSSNSIARIATMISNKAVPTQKSTRPIRIFCALQDKERDVTKGDFDFVLLASNKTSNAENRDRITVKCSEDDLYERFISLNFHKEESTGRIENVDVLKEIKLEEYKVSDTSLLTFNLQFNQLLMLINNPILFPHRAYAKMFNGSERK